MSRWQISGRQWLDGLQDAAREQCRRWDIYPCGKPLHGSNAVVFPVKGSDQPAVLKMTPPGESFAKEVAALQFWNGRGTAKILQFDLATGAMLLEQLDSSKTLNNLPLHEAVPIAAGVMKRLAIPVMNVGVPSTAELVSQRIKEMPAQWDALGQPFSRDILSRVIELAAGLETSIGSLAVNGDLHYGQIIPAVREEWLAVDPILFRGDIEYDLAHLLWSRLDEMETDEEIMAHFNTVVRVADLDYSRAMRWVIFRSTDYWLWGLQNGLTEDPERCRRILSVFITES